MTARISGSRMSGSNRMLFDQLSAYICECGHIPLCKA
jgi:hypothetical protein